MAPTLRRALSVFEDTAAKGPRALGRLPANLRHLPQGVTSWLEGSEPVASSDGRGSARGGPTSRCAPSPGRPRGGRRRVERALESVEGVDWARVNPVIGRVVVVFDPDDGPSVDDLVDIVDGVEVAGQLADERFPHDRPEHPGDIEPLRRNAIAIGADVLGLGVSTFGQLLRLGPFPVEIAAVVALAENEPRVRQVLERRVGVTATDLGLGLAGALAQGLSQGPLGLVADITNRANAVGELQARRQVFERREPELAADRTQVGLGVVPPTAEPPRSPRDRSSATPTGPHWPRSPPPARPGGDPQPVAAPASFFAAGVPKAARHGREAFAAHLGRELARRDVVVLDGTVLRRLDRVDTVVLDAESPHDRTPRAEPGGRPRRHRGRRAAAPGPGDVEPRHRAGPPRRAGGPGAGRWPRSGPTTRGPASPRRAETGPPGRAGLLARGASSRAWSASTSSSTRWPWPWPGVGSNGDLVAGRHRPGRAPVVPVTVGCRRTARHGHPGGGRGVLLVSGGAQHRALGAADCAVGVAGRGAPTPWSADIVTRSGLADAHLVASSLATARQVSTRSAQLALVGSGLGAAWSVVGLPQSRVPPGGAAGEPGGHGGPGQRCVLRAAALAGARPRRTRRPRGTPWRRRTCSRRCRARRGVCSEVAGARCDARPSRRWPPLGQGGGQRAGEPF